MAFWQLNSVLLGAIIPLQPCFILLCLLSHPLSDVGKDFKTKCSCFNRNSALSPNLIPFFSAHTINSFGTTTLWCWLLKRGCCCSFGYHLSALLSWRSPICNSNIWALGETAPRSLQFTNWTSSWTWTKYLYCHCNRLETAVAQVASLVITQMFFAIEVVISTKGLGNSWEQYAASTGT